MLEEQRFVIIIANGTAQRSKNGPINFSHYSYSTATCTLELHLIHPFSSIKAYLICYLEKTYRNVKPKRGMGKDLEPGVLCPVFAGPQATYLS